MAVQYIHLDYEAYKSLEQQIGHYQETTHKTVTGFYHKSIRFRLGDDLVIEFHGPLVGGTGHTARRRSKRRVSKRRAIRRVRKVAAKKR